MPAGRTSRTGNDEAFIAALEVMTGSLLISIRSGEV
jgi:hypothetical protein